MTARDKFQVRQSGSIAAITTDQQLSAIVPLNEKWHIDRVVFAHANDSRNWSGGFQLEWGSGGSFVFITGAYLTGATFHDKVDQTFIGDGAKRFRLTRQNLDPTTAKQMSVVIDGFKRIGD
jgi:hypothetical protein